MQMLSNILGLILILFLKINFIIREWITLKIKNNFHLYNIIIKTIKGPLMIVNYFI